MKFLQIGAYCWLLCFSPSLHAQTITPEVLGFRHLRMPFQGDTVDILVQSRAGEADIPKPLLLFCQGSLPQPLIKTDGGGAYGVFPFAPDSLLRRYHLVIAGKPGIPLIADVSSLGPNFTWQDRTGQYPTAYTVHNLLSYYVRRNEAIIRLLQRQPWATRDRLVVAGHSEGSTIAARLARTCPRVTHLIYSGGNPMGRITSILAQSRASESDTDSTRYGESTLAYWAEVVAHADDLSATSGDSHRTTFEFSEPPILDLRQLRIPVLVTYGTRDWGAPYVDYLRVEMIRNRSAQFYFKPYIGTEHNYFPLLPDGRPDYSVFTWDQVAVDWAEWLEGH